MNIPKNLRFEVFKRDKFTCRYCGRSAPEIVLHCDHIHPLSMGGETSILNLITACADCNLGKGATPLSDDTAISKKRDQLADLQERREQLEMLMEWQEGLRDFELDVVDRVVGFWNSLTPGWTLSDGGKRTINSLISKYPVNEVMAAMRASAASYLEFEPDGSATTESVRIATKKIKGCLTTARVVKEKPYLKDLFYIRAIVRSRCRSYFNPHECLSVLEQAYDSGVPASLLRTTAMCSWNWREFSKSVDKLVAQEKERKSNG